MAKDPVCGMEVAKTEAAGTVSHKGIMYYFCAISCKDKFIKEPDRYITGKPSSGCCDGKSSSDCGCCG